MKKIFALCAASWQTMLSYRLQAVLGIVGLLATVVPLFFISGALQPLMANSIKAEGGQSFGFLLVGLATFSLVATAIGAVPSAVGSGIGSGVLEALMATPTRTPTLLAGLSIFPIAWAMLKAGIMLGAGWFLGANLIPSQVLPSTAILLMIIAAYIPVGLVAAAFVVAFRTAGPLPKGVILVSGFLGGVYYPTHVIPSWLQSISAFIPLTYGLRALRKVLLEGASLASVAPDLLALSFATLMLFAVGIVALTAAFRYARRNGTLSQY